LAASAESEREQLLAQAKGGDRAALGRLLEYFRVYLEILARVQIGRRLQGKVDAADAVQEAFLGASRDLSQFRGTTEREFTAWLRQILASLLANMVRHYIGTQRRDARLERQLVREIDQSSQALDGGLVARQSSPSEHAMRGERAIVLAEALQALPADWRDVLVLRHLEGLTFPQVAERMGRTLDSVKKLWPRALAKLRQGLEGIEW